MFVSQNTPQNAPFQHGNVNSFLETSPPVGRRHLSLRPTRAVGDRLAPQMQFLDPPMYSTVLLYHHNNHARE